MFIDTPTYRFPTSNSTHLLDRSYNFFLRSVIRCSFVLIDETTPVGPSCYFCWWLSVEQRERVPLLPFSILKEEGHTETK